MPSFIKVQWLFSVVHQQFATDHYTYGATIVGACSKEHAMEKLNDYLATKPDGVYTALPCESIDHVSYLEILN